MKLRSFSSLLSAAVGAAMLMTSLATPQVSQGAPPGPIYAQLSSSMSQKASLRGTLVTMDSNDALSGLAHDDKGKGTDITIKTDGRLLHGRRHPSRQGEGRRPTTTSMSG